MSLAAIFQIGSLGDSVVSLPSLLSARDLLPSCSEYLLVSRFDSALKVLPGHVFDMAWKPAAQISYRGPNKGFNEIVSIASLVAQLRYYRPRHCLYLMPIDRTQNQIDRDKLFFKAGGVQEFIGFCALSGSELSPDSRPSLRDTQAYLRFRRLWGGEAADRKFASYAKAPLLRPSPEACERVSKWLRDTRRYPERPLVAICPYSNSPSKDLPQETISQLRTRLEKSLSVETVLLGGRKDIPQAQALATVGLNACGIFSLEESAALLQACSLAVCVDSGPMHVAGALGVPLVIVFSRMNTQLARWFPLGDNYTILYREVSCAGCRLQNCNVAGHPCIAEITLEQIASAVSARLSGLPILPGCLADTLALQADPVSQPRRHLTAGPVCSTR